MSSEQPENGEVRGEQGVEKSCQPVHQARSSVPYEEDRVKGIKAA